MSTLKNKLQQTTLRHARRVAKALGGRPTHDLMDALRSLGARASVMDCEGERVTISLYGEQVISYRFDHDLAGALAALREGAVVEQYPSIVYKVQQDDDGPNVYAWVGGKWKFWVYWEAFEASMRGKLDKNDLRFRLLDVSGGWL